MSETNRFKQAADSLLAVIERSHLEPAIAQLALALEAEYAKGRAEVRQPHYCTNTQESDERASFEYAIDELGENEKLFIRKASANTVKMMYPQLEITCDAFLAGLRHREEQLRVALAEVVKWKDEYQNVCKFANDYEAQRDQLRAELAEQARLNGMVSEREARLMAEVARLREGLEIFTCLKGLKFSQISEWPRQALEECIIGDSERARALLEGK